MEKVKSKDGTPIAYYRSGSGEPLVLVHGISATAARWRPLLPKLEEHFSVYLVERRGRGESGEGDTYALQREFEDIAAVVDSIGAPVYLLGHSSGGLVALEAALLTPNVRKLVLYEPPLPPDLPQVEPEVVNRLQALLDTGDREGVMTTFFREVVRMPSHEFEPYRETAVWPTRVALAHTLPRELRAQGEYEFDARRFKELQTTTLLLLGGDSPPFAKAAIEALDSALPNSRIAIMPGQQHIAMDTAPDLFLHEVLAFLKGLR